MSIITKPMLASAIEDTNLLRYSENFIASPKLDGIRALVIDGQLVSRTFKPIPNRYIKHLLSIVDLEGSDGELTVGDTFNSSSSGVMSHDGTPDFVYHIFDNVSDNLKEDFSKRLERAKDIVNKLNKHYIKFVEHKNIANKNDLLQYEEKCLVLNYEGVMLRSAKSPYKCGRSSLKEGYLLKLKVFSDAECEILGFDELMSNQNEAELDAFGHTKRSSKAEGMVPADTLGAFLVKDIITGVEFKVSTGLTAEQRSDFWKIKDTLIGKIIKYKSQPSGVLEKPRFPVFLGIRSPEDM